MIARTPTKIHNRARASTKVSPAPLGCIAHFPFQVGLTLSIGLNLRWRLWAWLRIQSRGWLSNGPAGTGKTFLKILKTCAVSTFEIQSNAKGVTWRESKSFASVAVVDEVYL